MRAFTLDKYNTWYDWRLTLTAKEVTPPEPKTNYISLDGAHGSLDLTEALTGEIPFDDRTVSASFWTSEGTFAERVELLRTISTALHGRRVQIIEPDDPEHFFLGRIVLKSVEQSQVHLAFDMEATCEPWRYALEETTRAVAVSGSSAGVVLYNGGVKVLSPDVTVTGTVTLTFDGASATLEEGSYRVTGLRLQPGNNLVTVSGSGSAAFTFREAML